MASSIVDAEPPPEHSVDDIASGQATEKSKGQTPCLEGDCLGKTVTAASTTRPPTIAARKKLPWLEGKSTGASLATQPRSRTTGDLDCHTPSTRAAEGDKKAAIYPLGNDLALRAIGSTPTLKQNHTRAGPLAFSQSSQLPPGSKLSSLFMRRPTPARPPKTFYASSEYSATNSEGGNHTAVLWPKKASESPGTLKGTKVTPPFGSKGAGPVVNRSCREVDTPSTRPESAAIGRESEKAKLKSSPYRTRANAASNTRTKGRNRSSENPIKARANRSARLQLQRGSIAPIEDPIYRPPATRPFPTKKSTLHKLPLHLVASSESESSSPRDIQPARVSSLPSSVRSGVHYPGPILSTAWRHQPSEDLSPLDRVVTGLSNLMEESVHVTQDAVNSDRPDQVSSLLKEAALALQQAESVNNILGQPLVLSPVDSLRSSDTSHGERSSSTSSLPSKEASAETMPTIVTNSSRQPLLTGHPQKQVPRARCGWVGDRLRRNRHESSPDDSISQTPPHLYSPPSAESIVRDFAYGEGPSRLSTRSQLRATYGAAASFYGDHGESVVTQPGIRRSFALTNERLHDTSHVACNNATDEPIDPKQKLQNKKLRRVKAVSTNALRYRRSLTPAAVKPDAQQQDVPHSSHFARHFDTPAFMQPAYYRDSDDHIRQHQTNFQEPPYPVAEKAGPKAPVSTDHPALLISRNLSLKHPRRGHLSIQEDQGFSLGRYHKRQPIAREWNSKRKRLTAIIACLNTIFIGLIAGIYAGEVPRIQYQLGDQSHWVIFGNMLFFAGLGLSTLIFWPLPLLHGRKPYVLLAFGIILPLQIPQAIIVSDSHGPNRLYTVGLLLPRALTGFALGFANINFLPTLWDLYGASLMSERPHQEVVTYDDVRRQGGGIGVWLGIWTFCFSSSLAVGFCIGACIISRLEPSWGFYIIVMLLAIFLLINVITPETRRAPYRRSISHFFDEEDPEKIKRRVARGEVKLHIYNEGPKWWYEEIWAGLVLTKRMMLQPGFFVLMSYLGWIQAQLTLVILLLGALLSREYAWQSQWVGLATLAVPAGAMLAMPLTKASWLSRERTSPPRTDSMTFQPHFSWSTHLLRRIVFSMVLPFAGLAYCMVATGPPLHWMAVIIFTGLVGFLTDLGIAECVGIIMETFDTSDLQPGVNTKHRLQSLSDNAKRQRTNYSAFPRVCAGFFAAQSLGFFLAAATTVAAGKVTNTFGTQTAVWSVAAILLGVTILLLLVMWRWKSVQVIPDFTGDRKDSKAPNPNSNDPEWRPVMIGKPSGKVRRMNILETGDWTRWTEIRKLNKLIKG